MVRQKRPGPLQAGPLLASGGWPQGRILRANVIGRGGRANALHHAAFKAVPRAFMAGVHIKSRPHVTVLMPLTACACGIDRSARLRCGAPKAARPFTGRAAFGVRRLAARQDTPGKCDWPGRQGQCATSCSVQGRTARLHGWGPYQAPPERTVPHAACRETAEKQRRSCRQWSHRPDTDPAPFPAP